MMQVEKSRRYVYPFNDFAFKKLFGRGPSKLFLVDFLNALINPGEQIVSIKFLNTEKLGRTKESRKSIFDIFCEDEAGNKFIIEIQKVLKPYFFDRMIYYSAMAIQDHAAKGEWNFNIKSTYTICLIDNCFDIDDPEQVVNVFKLVNVKTLKMQEQLIIYNIELPKFKKTKKQLVTRLDVWLYVLNNLSNFEEIPEFLNDDPVFKSFFMEAEIANYNREEHWAYLAAMDPIWEANRTKAWKEEIQKYEERVMKYEERIMKDEERVMKYEERVEKDKEQTRREKELVEKDKEQIRKDKELVEKDKEQIRREKERIKVMSRDAELKLEEGIEVIIKALQLKKAGVSTEEIVTQTGLTLEHILQL